MKSLTLLGSTGSIGKQALDVVRKQGTHRVSALAAGHDVQTMEAQIREFSPRAACLTDEAAAADLRVRVADCPVTVLSGEEGLLSLIRDYDAGLYLLAIVGMAALKPALAVLETGTDLAIASKEPIVAAGHLLMPAVKEKGIRLLPVDSEHSAIFQCLRGEDRRQVHRILLTCSGGPFRGRTRDELKEIRPADALAHPRWTMGAKITVDSSTLVNKGLEVIEAHYLFDMPYEKIRVLVHPQSIIHSMVEYDDGAVIAQLGSTDMRLPIQLALNWPDRLEATADRLDFAALKQLTFEEPDFENFPALRLAYEAGRIGGSLLTVYNCANEWAVARFLKGELSYLGITEAIEKAMAHHSLIASPSLSEILETEQWVYEFLNH